MEDFCNLPVEQRNGIPLLPFRVDGFEVSPGEIRHILLSRAIGNPTSAASLYEAHLADKTGSPYSRKEELRHLAYMYTWALESDVRLENLLLRGYGLTDQQIRSFSRFLQSRWSNESGGMRESARKTHNKILFGCGKACAWFIEQFQEQSKPSQGTTHDIHTLAAPQKKLWLSKRKKVSKYSVAPDLTDDEIEAIDSYLEPERRSAHCDLSVAVRDFLMWRMARDFGMRAGEILSMRLGDCPSRGRPYFSVVRIEERRGDPPDPRGHNAPRPKTLTRDLGFSGSGSVFPGLVNEYISRHRFEFTEGPAGKRHKRFVLSHNYLIVSGAGRGTPLSRSAMTDVAARIRTNTGVKFHWHLARHAYFNRAYE